MNRCKTTSKARCRRAWFVLFLILGVTVSATGRAQGLDPEALATAQALRDRALETSQAFELVESLTVEVGPRLAGSPGDRAAVAWGEAKLKALGFAKVRTEPVIVPQWVRGVAKGEILAPFPQPVVLTALGGSVSTPAGGLEAEVLQVESLEALVELPEGAAQGKIVFFDGGPMERARDGRGYRTAVAPRGRGAAAAAPLGAAAVLIRSAGTSTHRFAHTGGTRYTEDAPRIPAAALSNADADLLSAQVARAAGQDRTVRFRLVLETEQRGEVPSANVIGEIVGRERPQEVVLLAAHLDSWDLGTGAVDDGAGVAIVTEAARLIGALETAPRRTVRVVLFANEEFGLSGARAYAEAHAEELESHVAAMEADFGDGAVWLFRAGVEPEYQGAADAIAAVLAPLGIEAAPGPARGGADLSPLVGARVPFFDLIQDGSRYFDVHHTADDTLDKIVVEELNQNVAAYAVAAYLAAEIEGGLGRAPAPPEEGDGH